MTRCLIWLGGSLLLIFLFIAITSLRKESHDLKENNKRMINVLSQSLGVTLKDYMLNADSEGLKNFFQRQREILKEIKDIIIVRKSGVEAFKDNKTKMQVEDQELNVSESENESFRYFQHGDEMFNKVLSTVKPVAFEKGDLYIEISPIVNEEDCQSCHSYDSHPVLGVIVVETSLGELRKAISANRNRLILFYVASFAFLLILLGWILKKQVIRPIEEVTASIQDIAEGEGDLTRKISTEYKDEIGELAHWFNIFVEKLNAIIKKIAEVTGKISITEGDLSKTVQATTDGAKKQNLQTDQIATAMEEMSATVIEIANNTSEAANSANKASDGAAQGEEIVEQTVKGMNRIHSSVKESADVVGVLSKSSGEIGQIISVIEDIADQTNLLALNAAIEAARAGEHGRGFAVVADEVRNLSDRTTKATQEIAKMIQQIQSETSMVVGNMEAGIKDVAEGVVLAQKAGKSLHEIMGVVRNVSDLVTQIAAATEEHSTASEEVTGNVEIISNISQETSQLADRSSEGIEELNRLARELSAIVDKFKL